MLLFATKARRPPPVVTVAEGVGVAPDSVGEGDAVVDSDGVGDVAALPPVDADLQPAAASASSTATGAPERRIIRRTLAGGRGSGGWLCVMDALRLFAAIDPPPLVRAQLSAALPQSDERLRYGAPEQWHLTLAFYGSVAERKVEPLRDGLGRAVSRSRPLKLRLAGAGTFPRQSAKARVLWVGLDGDVDELRRLASRCAGAGRHARIAMEARAFRAHLTVARARQGSVDATEEVAALADFTSDWWTVDVVRLVHSTLGSQVVHSTLSEFVLGATAHGER